MNLIDMHCDTIWKFMDDKTGATLRRNPFCIDIDGMKKAGTMAQFFACFVYMHEFYGENRYSEGYQHALNMIERMQEEVKAAEDEIAFAACYDDIRNNQKENKISAVLTVEEGGILDGKIERLEELYKKGIRLMTILWNDENCIGFPNSREEKIMKSGLKPFGFEVIERMNELGMVIDVSHLSDGGFWDVIRTSKTPIVASHSNARSLCNHPRNLTDEMIKALAEKGGVASVNFYPYFLHPSGKAGIEEIICHVNHLVNIGGIESVAIGTDFDGFDDGELKLTHVRQMEQLWNALKKSGFSEFQIDKIWSGNALRVIKEIM